MTDLSLETAAYVEKLERERDALREALSDISGEHEKIHQVMRDNNLSIDDLDNTMQKLAFTIYNHLVGVSHKAEQALAMCEERE